VNEKLLYRKKNDLYEEIITLIRKAYSESIEIDIREQEIQGVISMGFDNFLELYGGEDNRKTRDSLFNIFFDQLFNSIPELNLGAGMREMAHLECVFQFGVTYLYNL